jgi:hypothetical protein
MRDPEAVLEVGPEFVLDSEVRNAQDIGEKGGKVFWDMDFFWRVGRARQLMYVERVSSIVHGHLNLELKSALRDISTFKAHGNRFALPQVHNLQLGGVGSS